MCHLLLCLLFPGGRYVVQEDGLQILNAIDSDAGNYTCRAEVDEFGRYDEQFISVAVNSAFLFLEHFCLISLINQNSCTTRYCELETCCIVEKFQIIATLFATTISCSKYVREQCYRMFIFIIMSLVVNVVIAIGTFC